MKDSKFIEAYMKIISEGTDDVPEMNNDQDTSEATSEETPLKKVTFLTSDATLIDALNSGFEKAVFFVNAKDEEGEDAVEEVEFKSDSFGSIEVTDAPEEGEGDDQVDEGDDQVDECGDSDVMEDDDQVNEGEECDCEPSEWIEDGVCLKCGSSECDGTCKGSDAFQKMAAEEDGDGADDI